MLVKWKVSTESASKSHKFLIAIERMFDLVESAIYSLIFNRIVQAIRFHRSKVFLPQVSKKFSGYFEATWDNMQFFSVKEYVVWNSLTIEISYSHLLWTTINLFEIVQFDTWFLSISSMQERWLRRWFNPIIVDVVRCHCILLCITPWLAKEKQRREKTNRMPLYSST